MNSILAVVGSGLVNQLFVLLILGICVALIWWVGKWFLKKFGAKDGAMTVWNGIFVLLGLVVVLDFLLGLAGRGFLKL